VTKLLLILRKEGERRGWLYNWINSQQLFCFACKAIVKWKERLLGASRLDGASLDPLCFTRYTTIRVY